MAVGDLVGHGFHCAGFSVPQLGRLAGYAEGCIHRFVAVLAVVHEVDIAIVQLAMNEQQASVALRLGVVEVGRYLDGGEDIAEFLPGVYGAFAYLVYSRTVAEQLVIQHLEFDLIVGEAGIIGRFWSGNHGAIDHQFVNGAQNRQRHVLAIRIKSQDTIFHAAGGGDPAVGDAQFVDQRVSVDVVEAIARGHIGRLPVEDRGQV